MLIEAFAGLADKFPDWNVELWGDVDGKAYYKELEFLISKHALKNRVFLKGRTQQVPKVLQQGDLFVFPSAYEGFPLALGEAMSMGLPCVGYRSCVAIRTLIHDGVDGLLCDDGVAPLQKAMAQLMENRDLRVSLGRQAKLSMREFAPDAIWNQWVALLEAVIAKK